jgi:hypothetical protein
MLGCASEVDNPSIYESEEFLCTPDRADEWQARIEECRRVRQQGGGCDGFLSFAGSVQAQSIVIDSQLEQVILEDSVLPDGARVRDVVKLDGVGPYFRFRLRFWDIGGSTAISAERSLQVVASQPVDPAGTLTDDYMGAALRLSASSQSLESAAQSGVVVIKHQTALEQAGSFQLQIHADEIEGCFHAFKSNRTLNP